MRARLIKEYNQNFIRGQESKLALGVGLLRDLLKEKPEVIGSMKYNFWKMYPYEEYVRLMKEYFSQKPVIKFLEKNNINKIEKIITYVQNRVFIEIVDFKFYHNKSLKGLGELILAWPADQGDSWSSKIGTERNRMYNNAGQIWDKFYIRPKLKSIFDIQGRIN